MDRRFLLVCTFVPAVFVAYACGGDDEAPAPPEQDGGTGSSSGGSSSGNTSSSGGSSSGSTNNDGGQDGGPTACVGNPLADDAGAGDGGVIVSSDGGTVKQIVTTPGDFLDGPHFTDIFDGGALVYSEVFAARTVSVPPTGGSPTEFRQMPGTPDQQLPIGNAQKGSAILTVVANENGSNTGLTPGVLQTFLDGGAGPKLTVPNTVHEPNDLVVAKNGVIFFTDPAYQSGAADTGVYKIATDGNVTPVKQYTGDRPDGIALAPDDSILYVAMSAAKRIERFTVDAAGVTAVATPAAVAATYIDDLEGIAVDTGGNLWVAESKRPTNGDNPENGGRVEVFTQAGTKLGEITFPDHRPINIAFGGADNKTVFIVTNRNGNGNAGGAGTAAYSGQVWTFTSRCAGVR